MQILEGEVIEQHEIDAFNGLNESYIEMEAAQMKLAPRCHFRPMNFVQSDYESYEPDYWECSVCGHGKEVW